MFHAVFAIATLLTASSDVAGARPPGAHARRATLRRRASDLYSTRFRREVATYLRLRLLELRREDLGRAAEVIERRLPVETLLGPAGASPALR